MALHVTEPSRRFLCSKLGIRTILRRYNGGWQRQFVRCHEKLMLYKKSLTKQPL